MQTLEALSARMHTTAEIHSIVRTMKSLSSVSIRQYERAAAAMLEYERTVDLGLQAVLRDQSLQPQVGSPAEVAPGSALIVIGSDRGLCGRFNDRIGGRAVARLLEESDCRLCVLGQRVAAHMEAEGHMPDALFALPGSAAGLTATVHAVAVEIDRWTEAGVGTVSLLFNRRAGASLAVPTEWPLLPVPRGDLDALARKPWPSRSLPTYRMAPTKLFSWLIGQRIFVQIYRALAESLASEHAARLAAMRRAEGNISDHREELMDAYRQKRQEEITRELLDIISGFEAVDQGDPA